MPGDFVWLAQYLSANTYLMWVLPKYPHALFPDMTATCPMLPGPVDYYFYPHGGWRPNLTQGVKQNTSTVCHIVGPTPL